jgi:hypothetical protein
MRSLLFDLVKDGPMTWLVHAALFGLVLYALFQDGRAVWRGGSGGVSLVVGRGNQSMTQLYVFYGVTTIAVSLVLQMSEAVEGYKVGLLLIDYAALTYLCYFNYWFRNRILAQAAELREERR